MNKIGKMIVSLLLVFVCLFFWSEAAYASTSYIVAKGDTLSTIAKLHYDDEASWRLIYESNKDIIQNPNLIQPGWAINLPDAKDTSRREHISTKISRSQHINTKVISFKATAYDLSVASCGKLPSHPQYGLTSSGKSISKKTRTQAACVAVDPKVISIGSLLLIKFDDPDHEKYNGTYQALDTGGGVRGNHIDVFLGDFKSSKANREAIQFGVTKAKVVILRKGW